MKIIKVVLSFLLVFSIALFPSVSFAMNDTSEKIPIMKKDDERPDKEPIYTDENLQVVVEPKKTVETKKSLDTIVVPTTSLINKVNIEDEFNSLDPVGQVDAFYKKAIGGFNSKDVSKWERFDTVVTALKWISSIAVGVIPALNIVFKDNKEVDTGLNVTSTVLASFSIACDQAVKYVEKRTFREKVGYLATKNFGVGDTEIANNIK